MAQPYKIEGCLFLAKIYPGVWGSICWLTIDVLQSYREQIHEKLKCVAQPYKMEVLTEVGWILCWRDREL